MGNFLEAVPDGIQGSYFVDASLASDTMLCGCKYLVSVQNPAFFRNASTYLLVVWRAILLVTALVWIFEQI